MQDPARHATDLYIRLVPRLLHGPSFSRPVGARKSGDMDLKYKAGEEN
jgi:hypothetical protein